ncbi:MAG: DUF4910 domain-containing protein [Acidimicrobiia bacterium]|nr:DUF4910 domain-containing protein [Acidimicrobiia bacterium]
MYDLVARLHPINRSITGEGFRETQRILAEHLPGLQIEEVPTGTKAFDWTVPREWNIREAYLVDPSGKRFADFAQSTLHLMSYSVPVRQTMELSELKEHLHTLPEEPDLIPYRTSYYNENWGFCLSHREYEQLEEGRYEVVIDSELSDGSMSYGEYFLPGESKEEILITSHACHPSMCNDNLSGNVVATFLAKVLAETTRRWSYRFLFLPGGIGSVVWMSRNVEQLHRIRNGLVLANLGDSAGFTFKKSRRADAEIDRAAAHVLGNRIESYTELDFSPYGYDERNFCSPRFNLPVASLNRSTHEGFRGYHSSGDDLTLISAGQLEEALAVCLEFMGILEANRRYENLIPEAEPQLGKRGLYGSMGGLQRRADLEMALLWVMNFSDGDHSLLDIADRSGYDFGLIVQAAGLLREHGLLRPIADSSGRPSPAG